MSERAKTDECYKQRRCRAFFLPAAELARIFQGRVRVEGVELPPDAWVGGVHYEPLRNAFEVFIFSREYDPVPLAQKVPMGGSDGKEFLRLYQYPEPEPNPAPPVTNTPSSRNPLASTRPSG